MPRQSIDDLRNAIEAAPEMTPEHREEMLRLVDSLAEEVAGAEGRVDEAASEKLRGAIALAGDVVRRKAGEGDHEEHHLAERISELEEKVEIVALEHPVVANVLTAISRLI